MSDDTAAVRLCKRCSEPILGRGRTFCSTKCQKAEGRNKYLVDTYGITLEQWGQLYSYQGGVCAICKRAEAGNRRFVVDHEHAGGPSGRVRGLICSLPCNLKLVGKHKRGDILRAAADYLDNPPAPLAFGMEIIAPGRKPRKRQPRKRFRS